MKIRFTKPVSVEVEKTRLQEIWEKTFSRWDEVSVEEIQLVGGVVNITTRDGDVLLNVPRDSYVELKEEKKRITL